MPLTKPTPQQPERHHQETDKIYPQGAPSPEQTGLLPSRLAFSWFTPFIWKTRGNKPVSKADIPNTGDDLRSVTLSDEFEEAWDKQEFDPELAQSPKRLLKCLLAIYGRFFMVSGIYHVIAGASLQLTPFALGYFLQVMENRENGSLPAAKDHYGYLGCLGIFALLLIKTILGNQGYFTAYKTGIKIRSSLSAAIFNHVLEMSNGAKQIYPVGKTIKLVSADILKILNVLDYLHYIWLGPFQIIFTFVMVYLAIGWPALLSLAILCLAIPVQFLLTRMLVHNREMVCVATDKRIRVLQEMILGIRVIKLYGWESLFLRRLEDARTEELKLIRKQNLIYGCSIVLSVVVPAFSTVAAFLAYSMAGNPLIASVVSQVCLYFSMLDIPLFNIPLFINTGIDTQESLSRIQKFLDSEKVQHEGITVCPGSDLGLSIEEGDFDWDVRTIGMRKHPRKKQVQKKHKPLVPGIEDQHHPCRLLTITPNTTYDMDGHTWLDPSAKDEDSEIFCIRDIELKIPKGKLVAILGPVGSGKSSLLQAILGEMRSDGGSRVEVGGSIGYSPQEAWIMNGSVRDNILFGREFDENRYMAVLRQCAIDTDIASMPHGDYTLIGEKGISLSGGQKARINLARAVYSNPDVALLDDPLSAVDAKVCNTLFFKCIVEGLLHDKTRILVTHQLSFVPYVDHVVVMRNGRVSEQGTYGELMSKHSSFSEMMNRFIKEEEEDIDEDTEEEELIDADDSSVDEPVFEDNTVGVRIDPVRPAGVESKTIVASKRPRGVYALYVQLAGGLLMSILAIVVISANEFFRAGNDLWLTVWMLQSPWSMSQQAYRLIYVGFAVGLTLLTWACVLTFTLGGIWASKRLHNRAVERLFRSPISFFESTPLGRIVNRFSRDQEVVDTQVSDCIYFWLYIVATMVSTYIFIVAVSWKMAIVLTGAFVLVGVLQTYYSTCNWKLNKLYAQAVSPLTRQVTETFTGLTVIRVFGNEGIMSERFHAFSDDVTKAAFMSMVLKRWTSFRVEMLGTILVLIVSSLCYFLRIPSQLTGKILEFTLLVINSMDYFVRQYAEMEGNMVAVDRLNSYATALESEALDATEMPDLDPAWPKSGAILIRDLTIAYKPHLPPVIHGINASIKHGEKIAVVGRTGAGKSTIMSAIFRLVEPQGGTILIDGVDIRKISLKQLRTRITIVPQDPVLFSGTIRFNLDPTSSFSDLDIWEALDHVNSKGFVSKLSSKLDTIVQDFGGNFSIGQRQILCLARAILHRSPVILMDEPTASMDLETDELVQDAIRRCFADSTVINISHRLGMIHEYDKVIVMDAGKIIEFDSPEALLKDPKTVLAQLYAEYAQY